VFIQYLEHPKIIDIFKICQVIDYRRYVDILILYNVHTTNVNNTLEEFNKIHPKIKFTIEEENNKINFLDQSIIKTQDRIQFAIYRKPTTAGLIIRNNSYHPHEHKKALYTSY
jgi:hypothetical protein